jgi:hypothetical protein
LSERFAIRHKFADFFHPDDGENVPKDLINSEILDIGSPINNSDRGGGLVIVYKTKSGLVKKIVLDFNELGMWVSEVEILASG